MRRVSPSPLLLTITRCWESKCAGINYSFFWSLPSNMWRVPLSGLLIQRWSDRAPWWAIRHRKLVWYDPLKSPRKVNYLPKCSNLSKSHFRASSITQFTALNLIFSRLRLDAWPQWVLRARLRRKPKIPHIPSSWVVSKHLVWIFLFQQVHSVFHFPFRDRRKKLRTVMGFPNGKY